MKYYESLMTKETINWLLEDSNPSVKYYTLTDLLDKKESDSQVQKTKKNIMKNGVVPKILSKQNKNGYWDELEKFYTAKYKGTVWQLIILAELAADTSDARIKKACEFILEYSQDKEEGGFSVYLSKKRSAGTPNYVIPCLTGNMVYSLIKLGYLQDNRTNSAINWIVKYQRFDDGDSKPPAVWPYTRFENCFGKHSCHMGVVKSLKALSEIPPKNRTKEIKSVIASGLEYLMMHHIYKKSHDLKTVSKPGWLRFGFPYMYQTDVLEILEIISKLKYNDERMNDAVDHIISKGNKQGVWLLEKTFNGKYQTNIEQKSKPSKWITLKALTVLKRLNK